MKVKISELSGTKLDYAVAVAVGFDVSNSHTFGDRQGVYGLIKDEIFCPSVNWVQGGPIIEREITKLWRNLDGTFVAQIKYRAPYYSPTYDADIGMDAFINKHGDTALIAAMRCYVASKLGDDVEIPDEIYQ